MEEPNPYKSPLFNNARRKGKTETRESPHSRVSWLILGPFLGTLTGIIFLSPIASGPSHPSKTLQGPFLGGIVGLIIAVIISLVRHRKP